MDIKNTKLTAAEHYRKLSDIIAEADGEFSNPSNFGTATDAVKIKEIRIPAIKNALNTADNCINGNIGKLILID